jgi:flagellar hook-associated protein 1 FlgK
MSLGNILNIARSALVARRAALDATGHNIANANTEGYTRQRALIVASAPLRTAQGDLGTGVTFEHLERVRDRFLDASLRRESGGLGEFRTLQDILGQAEAVFGEPSDQGISAALDQFWDAWSDLSNNPTDASARSLVQGRGGAVASRLQGAANRLGDLASDVKARLNDVVGKVNDIATRLANLNAQLAEAESGGRTSPDLRDARDRLVDQLADLVPVQVIEHPGGGVAVVAGGTLIVDGAGTQKLSVATDAGGQTVVRPEGATLAMATGTGTVGALLALVNDRLPALRSALDQLTAGLVGAVNEVHVTGRDASGNIAGAFFDPSGVTASTIRLSPGVTRSALAIAAGASGAPGDNAIARAIADLRENGVPAFDGITIGTIYADLVTALGAQSQDTKIRTSAQETLLADATARRAAVNEVSVEEEMLALIDHQQAYSAAAALVRTANDMMDDLLNMVR